MSEYDDWKQENDRWEAYLYPNGVLRNKLGITKAAKWHKMEREFVAARSAALRPNTGLTTGNVGEELFAGTTSACAENTNRPQRTGRGTRNYLRVRGEYCAPVQWSHLRLELPPRARRILMSLSSRGTVIGTTSACAENTNGIPLTTLTWGNYLRVRGEYVASCCSFRERLELPPRTRRILRRACSSSHVHGTTSACAENTINLLCTMRGTGNYLRVRGEYCLRPQSSD